MQKKRCGKGFLLILFFLLMLAPVYGQSPSEIESLLNEKELSYEQAAYFTLAAALDEAPKGAKDAYAYADGEGWLPEKAENTKPINYKYAAFLLMKAFNLKGGMMYSFTHNARYAYRELKYLGFISSQAYSNQKISGEMFLQLLEDIIDSAGGEW